MAAIHPHLQGKIMEHLQEVLDLVGKANVLMVSKSGVPYMGYPLINHFYMGFSIIHHPFGNPHMMVSLYNGTQTCRATELRPHGPTDAILGMVDTSHKNCDLGTVPHVPPETFSGVQDAARYTYVFSDSPMLPLSEVSV